MDTKLKSKIEASMTVISLIAAIIGMVCIGIFMWNFISERYESAFRLLVKLF